MRVGSLCSGGCASQERAREIDISGRAGKNRIEEGKSQPGQFLAPAVRAQGGKPFFRIVL